jgi:hypothetical protein
MTCGHGETDEVGDAHATAMAAPSER